MIAVSELKRADLLGDLTTLTAGVRTLTARARSFGSIASSGAVLAAGLAAFRRDRSGGANLKSFWL